MSMLVADVGDNEFKRRALELRRERLFSRLDDLRAYAAEWGIRLVQRSRYDGSLVWYINEDIGVGRGLRRVDVVPLEPDGDRTLDSLTAAVMATIRRYN
jgi:hypothetical protein